MSHLPPIDTQPLSPEPDTLDKSSGTVHDHHVHTLDKKSSEISSMKRTTSNLSKSVSCKSLAESINVHDLPRNINLGYEIDAVITNYGKVKSTNSIVKTLYLGMLAGNFVVWGGIFAQAMGGGIPKDVRANWPILTKSCYGLFFPIAIHLIILFGGELFTGNTMVMTVSLLHRKVKVRDLATNWFLAFFGNLVGCLLSTYLFAYLSDLFMDDPWRSYVIAAAEKKVHLEFGVAFLRAIPANALVCISVFFGLSARDLTGKLLGMHLPILCFAAIGYEHCIANMYFIPVGMWYGADITVGKYIVRSMIPVTLGNIIGGALLVGLSEYVMFYQSHGSGKRKHKSDWGRGKLREAADNVPRYNLSSQFKLFFSGKGKVTEGTSNLPKRTPSISSNKVLDSVEKGQVLVGEVKGDKGA